MKSYFITYVICVVVMEEKYLQQYFANPTIAQTKPLSKELLHNTISWRVFFKIEIKRRKERDRQYPKNMQVQK